MAKGSSDSGSGFAAVFLLVLAIGIIIKFIWWVVGAAALVGLFFAGRLLIRQAQERRELVAERERHVRLRADRQRRWTLAGDGRAVYGPDGAAATPAVSPPPVMPDPDDDDPLVTAAMVATTREFAALVQQKPAAPLRYTDVVTDCARLLHRPLEGYRDFIAEMVDIVELLPKILRHNDDDVHLGAIGLNIDIDDAPRVLKRLNKIAR